MSDRIDHYEYQHIFFTVQTLQILSQIHDSRLSFQDQGVHHLFCALFEDEQL